MKPVLHRSALASCVQPGLLIKDKVPHRFRAYRPVRGFQYPSEELSSAANSAFLQFKNLVAEGSVPGLPQLPEAVPEDIGVSLNALIEKLQVFVTPVPDAAEKLGPGFATRLFGQLFDALSHPFSEDSLSRMTVAVSDISDALHLLFPDAFGDDVRSAVSDLVKAVQTAIIALSNTVNVGRSSHFAAFQSNVFLKVEEKTSLLTAMFVIVGTPLIGILVSMLSKTNDSTMNIEAEYEVPKKYSPDSISKYFSTRQFVVWSRCLTVLSAFGAFYIGIQTDRLNGKLKENEQMRAIQLRNIIERLGPTYVKVAQSLSTRVDILSKAYFTEIERLQDRVPPFSSKEAYALIEQELGKNVDEVFEQLTETTVASASLGQVYRGVLRSKYGGGEVAVKVQRPNVLRQVALDLYVARLLAIYVFPKIQKTKTDYLALVDEYATRFFQEMDYEQEAQNGLLFCEQMASIEGVVVPKYYADLTTRKILVSEWIRGEKLSESSAPDVRELCNTLLNVYLVQLLDTGFLHADPHPGNLIRTPDGKICIIDFGLMTTITKKQRDDLVEYIANLTTMNWKGVAYSLRDLGFIGANSPDPVEMGLVEPLELIFSQIVRGGGADALRKRIKEIPRLDQVRAQLDDLSKDFPFAVPTFFTLILRSFSVIEGIALGVDPQYSITMECFPYISRRILTDNDPRMNRILKGVLYGDKNHLDIDRIERVRNGLREFTVAGLTNIDRVDGQSKSSPVINATVREALEVLFSPRGSYIQDLLVEEMVAATDAMSREALSRLAGAYLDSVPVMISLRTIEFLGPLRSVVVPFLTPAEIVTRLQPALSVTKDDEEALNTIRGILRLVTELDAISNTLEDKTAQASMNTLLNRAASELAPMIPDLLPGVARITELFIRKLLSRVLLRLGEALESNATSEYDDSMRALE